MSLVELLGIVLACVLANVLSQQKGEKLRLEKIEQMRIENAGSRLGSRVGSRRQSSLYPNNQQQYGGGGDNSSNKSNTLSPNYALHQQQLQVTTDI